MFGRFKYRGKSKVKVARLKGKSRRPLQNQNQIQIQMRRAGGTPAYRQAGRRYKFRDKVKNQDAAYLGF